MSRARLVCKRRIGSETSSKPVHVVVAGGGPHFKRVYHRTLRKLMNAGLDIRIPLLLEVIQKRHRTTAAG